MHGCKKNKNKTIIKLYIFDPCGKYLFFRGRKMNKKLLALLVICFFFGIIFSNNVSADEKQTTSKKLLIIQHFSDPTLEKDNGYLRVIVNGTDSFTTTQGTPILPVFVKTLEFKWNTTIDSVEFNHSEIKTRNFTGRVKYVPFFRLENCEEIVAQDFSYSTTQEKNDVFPEEWYSIDKGVGLNKKGEHVLFLSIRFYPVRYKPSENILEYINNASLKITYTQQDTGLFDSNATYDLLIISPSQFSEEVQRLVKHKNSHNIRTVFKSVEKIYASYPGRDKPEKIKYFIKDTLEKWGIKYVLLLGDIRKIPIRTTDAFPWRGENGLLSDLYYTDIYDENYSFCTWDNNNNSIFGEIVYNFSIWPPKMIDLDEVDLYPDLHIGRIPCRNKDELNIMINKIMFYENNTYDQTWFKRIILAGGDTFPPRREAPFNVFEGEITNLKVSQELPDFEHVFLWTSKHNLHPWSFNRAVTKGAGFLSYAGHGFEHGWGTYRPNSLSKKMIFYFTPYLQMIRNQHKLPIVFFDACLTAKLDFNMSDLEKYFPIAVKLIQLFTGVKYDPSNYYPCFAYAFLNKEKGGAIAVVGATRSAYTFVDKSGVYAGAGYLDVHFFKAYAEGVTVGEMLTQAQNDYLNNVGKDYFTIEEYLLLGDPSLRVGGYP